MKRKLIVAAAIAAFASAAAWAQWGPGMMGDYGPGGYGMGPGMMWGYGPGGYSRLNLTDEQQAKIAEIQKDVARKQWEVMDKVHEQRLQLYGPEYSGKLDEAAARKAYEVMNTAHKAMFEDRLEARKRIDAAPTDEQRKQLGR